MWRLILTMLWMLGGLLWQSLSQASTYTVINENASGTGSLRWAVESANANTGPDTIDFSSSVKAIDPDLRNVADGGNGPLVVTDSLIIQGPGADKLKIDGRQSWIDISGKFNVGLPCNQTGTLILGLSGIVFQMPTPGVNLKVTGMTITGTGGILAAAGNRDRGIVEFDGINAHDNAPVSGVSQGRTCSAHLIDMGWGGELLIKNSNIYLNKIGFNQVNESGLVISRSNTTVSDSLFDTNSCYTSSGGEPCGSSIFGRASTWDLRVFQGDLTRYYGGTAKNVDIRNTRFNNFVHRVGFENHDTTGQMSVSITNSAFFERSSIEVDVQDAQVRAQLPAYTGVYAMNADLSVTNVSLLLPSYKHLGYSAQPLGAESIGSHLNVSGRSTLRVANSVIHTTGTPSLAKGERLAPLFGAERCGSLPGCSGSVSETPKPGNPDQLPYSYVDDGTLAAFSGEFVAVFVYEGFTPPGTIMAKNISQNGQALYRSYVGCYALEAIPGAQGACIMPKVPETVFETNPIFNSGSNALAVYPDGTSIHKDLVNRDRIIDTTVDMGAVEAVVTAKPKSYSTTKGVTLQVPASGVLANDLNCGTGPLVAQFPGTSATTIATPHGKVTLNPDGAFTYVPDSSYVGGDDFNYQIPTQNCPLGLYPAFVHIEVGPAAPQPTQDTSPIANRDTYSTPKDTPLIVPARGVLANDNDPRGGPLTAKLDVAPQNGIIQLSADGSLTYTPNTGFVGTDTFTYKAESSASGLTSASTVVSIGVANYAAGAGGSGGVAPGGANPLPPVANNDAWTLAENTTLNVTGAAPAGVIKNDWDPQGYQLTVTVKDKPANGSLDLDLHGGLVYKPNNGFVGVDTFTYTLSNSKLTSTAKVTLTVQALQTNRPPVGNPDAYATVTGVILSIPASGILSNDSDPEGHVLSARLAGSPAHGSVTLGENGGFTYTPNAGYSGKDLFTYQLSDGANTVGPITVNITVNPVSLKNLPPVARPDAWSTAKGTTITVRPANGVLVNDTDPEGVALRARLATYPKNGTFAPIDGGGFVYTPNAGFVGQDTLTYSVSDGQLESQLTTVTLTVNDKNTPPIANPDVFSIHSEELLTVPSPGVLLNDIDPEGHQLQGLLKSLPTHGVFAPVDGGGFTYLPDPGFTGEDSFTYAVNDGELESSVTTVTIRVTNVATNRVPLARPDRYVVQQGIALTVPPNGILVNDRDPNGHPLLAFQSLAPAHGSVHIEHDGSFTYYPNPDFVGQDSFDYYVNDGLRDSKPARVRITVKPSNRAPRTRGSYFQKPATDTVISVDNPGLLKFAKDPDGNFLTPFIVDYPAHGLLKLDQNGAFTYYPEAGFTGKDTFRWKVTDGVLDSNLGTAVLNCATCSRNE